jgi:AraC-like DNA-binding protein
MLLLTLACLRLRDAEPKLVELILSGQLTRAVHAGSDLLERTRHSDIDTTRRAGIGHLVGRALLVLGRQDDAEEFFQRQLKTYEAISRSAVRWHSSLDQGALCLSLNRTGRAAEAFGSVADDFSAPLPLRIEALAGLAVSSHLLNGHQRAMQLLAEAARMADEAGCIDVSDMIEAIKLDLAAVRCMRSFEELGEDVSQSLSEGASFSTGAELLRGQIMDACAVLTQAPLALRRLHYVHSLLQDDVAGPRGVAAVLDTLKALREDKLTEFETVWRIEAGLILLAHGDPRAAQEVLGSLVYDERTVNRHRHSLELKYCLSKLHALGGRPGEALRFYKEYARQAMYSMKSELLKLPALRVIERAERGQESDGTKLRLPLRYRRAYQFIVDHLDDSGLSVRQIAAHIDVSERALQMAFRSHLGVTPAQFIRARRMEHIRDELVATPNRSSVFEVASRWGVRNRSTLAHGYRKQFDETPSATLRG